MRRDNKDTQLIKRKLNIFLIFCVGIGGCLYGYNIGSISGILPIIRNHLLVSHTQASFFVSSFLWGVASIMIITGYIADVIGRKKTLIISSVLALSSITISYLIKNNIFELTAERFLMGVACGIAIITIPLYITETMPSSLRGRGNVTFQLFLSFGIFLSTLISFLLSKTNNWLHISSFALIPTIIFFIVTLSISESPRWLIMKHQYTKALRSLLKTRPEESAKKILNETPFDAILENNKFWRIAISKKNLPPLLLVFSIAILNQLTGINSFLQYDSVILALNGLTQHHIVLLGSIIITAFNFLMTIIAVFIVDRIERKKILHFGLIGIILCLIAATIVSYFLQNSSLKGILMIVSLTGYILFFALSPGAIIWVIISETLPSKIRSMGVAIALFLSSMSGATLATIFLPLEKSIGLGGIFMMCSITTTIYFFISFRLPCTNGKSLEEITNSPSNNTTSIC